MVCKVCDPDGLLRGGKFICGECLSTKVLDSEVLDVLLDAMEASAA